MWNFKRQLYATYNIPIIACSAGASSGGTGVAEYAIPLEKPLGGIVIIDFDAVAVSDKLVISVVMVSFPQNHFFFMPVIIVTLLSSKDKSVISIPFWLDL